MWGDPSTFQWAPNGRLVLMIFGVSIATLGAAGFVLSRPWVALHWRIFPWASLGGAFSFEAAVQMNRVATAVFVAVGVAMVVFAAHR
jgi:hypothetical protein